MKAPIVAKCPDCGKVVETNIEHLWCEAENCFTLFNTIENEILTSKQDGIDTVKVEVLA